MEPFRIAANANPPNKSKNTSFVHTAVLEGIAVFLFDRFSVNIFQYFILSYLSTF